MLHNFRVCTYQIHTSHTSHRVYGPSQLELMNHPSAPRHLVRSVEDFWDEADLPAVARCRSEDDWWSLVRTKCKGAKTHVNCLKHGRPCKILTAELHIAGIICVSWSPFGEQKGTGGKDFALFAAWAMTRRSRQDFWLQLRDLWYRKFPQGNKLMGKTL